jgi:hypothetical protein
VSLPTNCLQNRYWMLTSYPLLRMLNSWKPSDRVVLVMTKYNSDGMPTYMSDPNGKPGQEEYGPY